MSNPKKVIFVGLDSAEPDLLLRWSDEGILPTFRALQEKGIWASTFNPPRIYSGAVWPSFNTGVVPSRHGRYFYTKLDGYRIRGLRPTDNNFPPFWSVLNDHGKRIALIDIPYAEPLNNLKGIQVVDWCVHDRTLVPEHQRYEVQNETVSEYTDYAASDLYTYPASLASEVLKFGKNREGPAAELSGRSLAAFRAFRDRLIERIEAKTKFSVYCLDREPWDLFMTVFHEAHDVLHECWHIHDPNHPEHDPEMARVLGNPVKDIYVALDRAIATILDRADEETLVIVLSSHGMGPECDGNQMLDLVLSRLEGTPRPTELSTVNLLNRAWSSIPPSIRTALSPLRNRVRRKVYEALVHPTRRKRKCFAIPTNTYCGGVRINLVGREPKGKIHPGQGYEEFCETLKRDLLDLVDADTGEPAVRAVLSYEEMFPRDIYTEDLYTGGFKGDRADLLVDWAKRSFRALKSSKIGVIERTTHSSRKGNHKDAGLFYAFGPGVQQGRLPNRVPVIDLAPTIAAVFGLTLPDVDGSSLSALIGRP